ncbi:ankyrin repeat-containing domain protein [Absidia repens]|uniref:Ankyrin repeat-containing domain protein n=1 Tax=Absidia repens TaxID=90262 RepID=A0A1X2IVV8_9FUNG|nr:ankyrin repeat-containing domain protein [Absidia repens]
MTPLQQQSKSKSNTTTTAANHLPITIPPPTQAKLGLKLQQSSPITSTPMMKSLSLSTTTTPDPITLPSPASTVEETIHHQKEQDDIVVSIPSISIWTAAEQGDIATLTYYIQHHPNPVALLNKRDPKTECTLIHLAVSSSSNINPYNTVDLLLTHGADPCARNVYNVQALHTIPLHCVESPQKSLALLLDHGADVNCRDGDGWTPLHYAARFCRQESLGSVLALLVERGANLAAVDASHKTAMFALLANGDHVDAFTYLIQQQQNDSSGANVLMLPSRGDFLDSATRRTHQGTIVLQAAKYLRVDCLEWLVHSKKAMAQVLPALTADELSYANQLIQQQQQQQQHHCQKIMSLLHQVSTMMEKEPVHSTSTVANAIQRRLSIISTRRKEHHQSQHHQSPLSAHQPPVPTAGHDKYRDQDEEDDDDEAFLVNSPNLIKRMANLFTRYKRTIVIQEQVV